MGIFGISKGYGPARTGSFFCLVEIAIGRKLEFVLQGKVRDRSSHLQRRLWEKWGETRPLILESFFFFFFESLALPSTVPSYAYRNLLPSRAGLQSLHHASSSGPYSIREYRSALYIVCMLHDLDQLDEKPGSPRNSSVLYTLYGGWDRTHAYNTPPYTED